MKTSIIITGAITGNSTLARSIQTYDCELISLNYGNYQLIFNTKKEAKKALWDAFVYLRSDKQDARNSMLSYSKYGSIRYDASIAEIRD